MKSPGFVVEPASTGNLGKAQSRTVPRRRMRGTACADTGASTTISCTDFGCFICCGTYDSETGDNLGFGCAYVPAPYPAFCGGGICDV